MEEPSYTSRRGLLNLIMGGAIGLQFGGLRPAVADPMDPPAGLSAPESAEIADVLDGHTLALKGGTRLRLGGIEAPQRNLAPGDAGMAKLADGARAALLSFVRSGLISLRFDAVRRDRYGRLVAQIFTSDDLWVQGLMIASGQARVHGDGRNRLGLRTLLQLETQARAIFWGIWADPAFAIRAADDPKLERLAGSFQIVEGRVFAAATVAGTGYINFGPDRHTDLTLVLKNPALDLGQPGMLDLSWLTQKLIRGRGWLDLHDGPSIAISEAEQIEVLET